MTYEHIIVGEGGKSPSGGDWRGERDFSLLRCKRWKTLLNMRQRFKDKDDAPRKLAKGDLLIVL